MYKADMDGLKKIKNKTQHIKTYDVVLNLQNLVAY